MRLSLAPPAVGIEPEIYAELILDTPYRLEVVADKLRVPWSLAFLPDGRLLVAECQGRVRVVTGGVLLDEPALEMTLPIRGTNGFLGLAVHPQFEQNHYGYLALNELQGGGPTLKVVRYREDANRLVDPHVILDNLPAWWNHTGCRLLFGPDGKLYVTLGDANQPELTQRLDRLNGNLFVGRKGALPEIYSYGHRNSQGIDFHPVSHVLWSTEHGPGFYDEFNRVLPGANYGWSVIEGLQQREGMLERPALAPSGPQTLRVVKFVMFGPKDWILWRISILPRISFVIYKLAMTVHSWTQLGNRKWPV